MKRKRTSFSILKSLSKESFLFIHLQQHYFQTNIQYTTLLTLVTKIYSPLHYLHYFFYKQAEKKKFLTLQ